MSLLVENGGHQFGLTDRAHPEFGCHIRRTCLTNICGGVTIECARGVSFVAGTTMAKDDAYKAELAEECHHLSAGKDYCTRAHTAASKYQ